MGLLKTILKKFDKKTCYFFQDHKCLLSKSNCIACSICIKKINGIDSPKDYLNIVTTKNINSRNFWFAFLAFIMSALTLFIKVYEMMFPKQ